LSLRVATFFIIITPVRARLTAAAVRADARASAGEAEA
jgi:hypothetical protein